MSRTNCLERAGHILMLCIWLENRLIDLLILKRHPRIIKKLNASSSKTKLPWTLIQKRLKYWKKDFFDIKEEFIDTFTPKEDWKANLEGIYHWRNMLSHCYISLHREYLLFRPKTRKKMYTMIKDLSIKKRESRSNPIILKLHLTRNSLYQAMLKVFEEFDSVYLKWEAERLGIDYEKIR